MSYWFAYLPHYIVQIHIRRYKTKIREEKGDRDRMRALIYKSKLRMSMCVCMRSVRKLCLRLHTISMIRIIAIAHTRLMPIDTQKMANL